MKGVEILIKLNDKVSKGLGVINNNLHKTTQKLSDIENSTKSLDKLRTGALIAGGAIAVGLGMATHKAIQFSSALAPVKTVLSGTADEVESASARIGKHALSWSSQYKNSAEEYLGASYNLLSAGLNETQAIAGTNMALKLATATLGDATTSSALLGTLYNNFGNKANDANKEMMMLSDTVAKTQQLFQIANLGQLNEGLKYATASALSFRVGFDQTSAVVGQLNTLGLTGSMAGTSFNAMMGKLNEGSEKLGYTVAKTADGGIDLVKTLRNISSVGADADTIKKVFGDEGAKGVTLLTAKIGDLESNFKKVQQSAGATEVAFKKMFNSSGYQLDVLKGNFARFGASIGKPIEEALSGILLILNPILHGFNEFIAKNEWLAKIVVGLGVALSGLLLAFGSYVFWIKMGTLVTGFFSVATGVATGAITILNGILALNPFIAIAMGVIALITGIILLVKHWEKVVEVIKKVWDFMLNFIPNTINLIKNLRDSIAISLVKAWDSVVLVWNNGITSLMNKWESFKIKVNEVWNSIVIYAQIVWENIKSIFTVEWWLNLGNQIKSIFDQVFSFEFWKTQFENMLNSILGSVGKWWGNIKKIARGQKITEEVSPVDKVIEQEKKITVGTEYTKPKGMQTLNKDIQLPIEHTNFLAKNGLLRGNTPTILSAGSITKPVRISSVQQQNQKANKSTVINIANIEIADGVISNLEDFILQLNQRVIV